LAERGRGAAGAHKYLTFTLQGEVYAMGIEQVKEIIEFGPITVVPMMRASCAGDQPARRGGAGDRPVAPLRRRSQRGGSPHLRGDPGVAGPRRVDAGPQVIGVIVDAVSAVLDIAADAIEPPPASAPASGPTSCKAWARSRSASC
jgi:purine-binding chemotaxis protein CheW